LKLFYLIVAIVILTPNPLKKGKCLLIKFEGRVVQQCVIVLFEVLLRMCAELIFSNKASSQYIRPGEQEKQQQTGQNTPIIWLFIFSLMKSQ